MATPILSIKEFEDLIKTSECFAIKMYTPWCTKCKKLDEKIKSTDINYAFYKININDDPFIDDFRFEQISALPCIWIYKNGKCTELNTDNLDVITKQINE